MLPFIIGGIFLAGLMLGKKLNRPSEPWNNREEHQHFHKDKEQWKHDGWMLYR